jgi:hypothetical protein
VITKEVDVTSSDEEFLEATLTFERDEERKLKEKADSDEEFLQAVVELENIQLGNIHANMDGGQPEGPHQDEGDQHDHPHQEEGVREANRTPNPKLSPWMMKSHPSGNQEWMEGEPNRAGHEGAAHLVGGGHPHEHDQGAEEVHQEDGATGVAGSPPSSTSTTGSQTTPPSSSMTPGTSGARLACTPLWKKKSLLRMSSSSQAKKKKKRVSQSTSPAATPSRSSASMQTKSSTIFYEPKMSPTPEKARPGPELPPNSVNSIDTYHAQEQSASTSPEPTDVAGNLTNRWSGISAWEK